MANGFTPNGAELAKQRGVILAALRAGPLSTIHAREVMGIAHPAGRVLELRKLGHQIATKRGTVHDAAGRPHVSAVYELKHEAAP